MKTLSSLFAIGSVIVIASGAPPLYANSTNLVRGGGFEENKGQITTTQGDHAAFVKFSYSHSDTRIFLLENGIAYQFERWHVPDGFEEARIGARRDQDQWELLQVLQSKVRLETFRMDMILNGVDPDPRITTNGRSTDHTNYYTHDALRVHQYEEVTYHDIYPGIDQVIRTTSNGIKYDFIVHPGADPSLIELKFLHHEELYVDAKGRLIHGNHMGRFMEQKPVSSQGEAVISTSFDLQGNILRFKLDEFDRTKTLVIDPDRIWGTYYGGNSFDDAWGVATDLLGNVFMAGATSSTGAIASGGHQNNYGQELDAFLVKFDADGVRQWGTYYGGPLQDVGWSCAVDRNGNAYLSGTTTSTTAIANGGHQNTYGGGMQDAFLVKFDPDGVRIWATYYGGNSIDDGFHCTTDTLNNVYLSGRTRSAEGIAFNGHMNTPPGAVDDNAFLVKFDSTGTRIWATYYGGTELDNAQCAAVDDSGNVYLTGSALSLDGIASGGHQNMHGGGSFDAYLVRFDTAGVRQWATYYGGTELDQGWSCAVDAEGNVFMAGRTSSASLIAVDGHQQIYAGSADAYLVKFDSAGTLLWGTYYGGPLADEAYGCATDELGNVYFAGLTQSAEGIAAGGHQNIFGGGSDAFLAKFAADGTRLWGTYYGGAAFDPGFGCTTDPFGSAYLTGFTSSPTAIAADGHQNTYAGGSRDAFLVKFEGGTSTAIGDGAMEASYALHLYPNPLYSGGTLMITGTFEGSMSIDMIDALGRTVFSERRKSAGPVIEIPIDASIDAGVYHVLIGSGDLRIEGRLVIE